MLTFNKTKLVIAAFAAVLLTACGGGGGGGGGGGTGANPLLKYEGTYYICDSSGHTRNTVTVTVTGSNAATLTSVQNVYANTNCTGALVGTYSLSQPITVTYQSQTTANFPRVTIMPTADTVDSVIISAPAMTASLTGTGVSGSCVTYTNGNVCFNNMVYASRSVAGAVYLRGNYVVTFSLTNGVLAADGIFSKDANFAYSMLVAN